MGLVDDLIDEACSATGLGDFGGDSFREGLERVTRALQAEAALNAIGQAALRGLMVGSLKARLHIEQWYKDHPETDDAPIVGPLIALGLPRTGSTALAGLLAEDPDIRYLRRWEAAELVPPPASVKESPDPRLLRQIEIQSRRSELDKALVPSFPNGPQECHELMLLDFKAHYFECFAHVPSYAQWLLEADLTETFQYMRRALKYLQWGQPAKPWRLKNPNHLGHLVDLDKAFPDARFVMTHRDPTEVLASVCDVFANVASRFNDTVDRRYIGAVNATVLTTGMTRALAFRDDGNDHRFHDIDFRAMQRDPISEVRGLYDWLGEPVTPAFEENMRRWWQENSADRVRVKHSDPADYGLDLDAIRPRFAEYLARSARWTSHADSALADAARAHPTDPSASVAGDAV
ncbi:sulfotransferase [Frankia sp. CNm7]|uniref:Sulfotransferase n=1 Tax=Frankia nepalensis TaxID=1836974 RepID=A0A937RE99_9ACTN|nr:sulfotransferase [Frankia nepalensis]MBL7494959.1 sulfotransferase [Frankia nepalensis]MBL7513661.1 sulfotransferase [Frankia nepalensis]MBL7524295.1 sulfotransferase [Frankia nepalensis]MBL7627274.1 sulfotransferase [Frankia nepalensis]